MPFLLELEGRFVIGVSFASVIKPKIFPELTVNVYLLRLIVPVVDESILEMLSLDPKTKVPLFFIVKDSVEPISPVTNNVPALIIVSPV